MIFEEASTGTRTSFEVAATLLGGHALYIRLDEVHLKSETLYDTAKVLSRMVDGIVIRATRYREITDLFTSVSSSDAEKSCMLMKSFFNSSVSR
jgi:ornithine carbamoyltransferase